MTTTSTTGALIVGAVTAALLESLSTTSAAGAQTIGTVGAAALKTMTTTSGAGALYSVMSQQQHWRQYQ